MKSQLQLYTILPEGIKIIVMFQNDTIHNQFWPIFDCLWMNYSIISIWHIIQINSLNEVISHGMRTSPHTVKSCQFLPQEKKSAFGL